MKQISLDYYHGRHLRIIEGDLEKDQTQTHDETTEALLTTNPETYPGGELSPKPFYSEQKRQNIQVKRKFGLVFLIIIEAYY